MSPVSDAEGVYLKQLELGPMQNFVYLVGDPVARQCVVVDPAWEIDEIVDTAAADGMTITGALVTHTHQDHVGGSLASWGMPGRIAGVEELLAKLPVKVYVHKAEREFLPGLGSDLVKVDNHDTLTGSSAAGKLYSQTATCSDWTSTSTTIGKPRVGHSWPFQGSGVNWISALDEGGCGAGINPSDNPPGPTKPTVGSGGGYGGLYCFALSP